MVDLHISKVPLVSYYSSNKSKWKFLRDIKGRVNIIIRWMTFYMKVKKLVCLR